MLEIQAKNLNLLHILLIICVGVIVMIPAILYGVFEGDDLIWAHLKWSKHFVEQFWQGDFYPKWLSNMNAGLGGPTFFFYAPIPYYFTSLFHPLFANDSLGWHQLSLSALLAMGASGITAYIWLKNITSQKSALIASLVYMTLPYHLAIDLYWRFAFAEYWSFVWIPLILFFSIKIINGSKLNILGLAVSYALLIMTHLLTTVMFSLIPISYILLIAGRHERKKALIRLLVAIILALGLSAIYWVPAVTTQEYVSLNAIQTGHFFYGNNFLFRKFVEDYNIWKYLEVTTPLMGVLAYCAFSIARTNSRENVRRESTYWFAVALIAVFMMLPLSKPLWDILPIVQKIQFPWRFNVVLTVAITALLALVFSSLKSQLKLANKKFLAIGILIFASLLLAGIQLLTIQQKISVDVWQNRVLLIVISLLLAVFIAYLKKPVNFFQQKYLVIVTLLLTSLLISGGIAIDEGLYRISNPHAELKISMDVPEYRPRWVPEEIFKPNKVSQLGSSSSKAQVSEGQGSLSIEQWKPRKIVLQTNATTDIWLTINQFYYPGWTAKIAGKSDLLAVQPSKPEGLLRVALPKGQHQLIVTLNAGVEERTGQIISAVSAIIALFSTGAGKLFSSFRQT